MLVIDDRSTCATDAKDEGERGGGGGGGGVEISSERVSSPHWS